MTSRYDIHFDLSGPTPRPHYCLECGRNNETHGYSWDEACKLIVVWHQEQAKRWLDNIGKEELT